MLQASRRPGFVCASCRALLASGGATLCAARHLSTTQQQRANSAKSADQSSEKQVQPAAGRRRKARKTKRDLAAYRLALWRETLDVLKERKTGQSSSHPAPPSPTPAAADHAVAASAGAGPPPSAPSAAPAGPSRGSRILEGALLVLRRLLRNELEENPLGIPTPAEEPSADAPEKQSTDEKPPAKAPSRTKAARPPAPEPQPLTGKRKKKGGQEFTVERINADKLELTPIVKPQPPVPRLAYGLDRVLFNPGVYHIQDPRSRVFNFDPYLARIMPIEDFDFNALKQYVTSSRDNTLIQTAAKHNKKYTGSTSSMTSTLAHFHYLLSAWRPINPAMMSREFDVDSFNFTRINRAPAATFLHWKDGTYAIDADKEFDTANILSMLGKSMEKFLTLPKDEFEKYRRTKSNQLTDEDRNGPESYHYTILGDFLMRSQLDAHDSRLPGTGMFDLKTRAVVSIRMDAGNFQKGMGYEIRRRFGQWESFEREYYDMIRSAFLKYSLQVRMGRMDGIFVAFHNTQRIFGFQYISLEEMDWSLHGQMDKSLGNREFKLSVHLLNKVLDKVTAKFPGQSLRLHFETRESSTPFMYIFAKPVTPEDIEQIQGARRAAVEEFEQCMMGVSQEPDRGMEEDDTAEELSDQDFEDDVDDAESEEEASRAAWENVMLKVEDELEDEERGLTFVREAVEDALQESGLLRTTQPDETKRYVDAFLEALTSNVNPDRPEAPSSSDTVEGGPAKAEEAGPPPTEESSHGVSEVGEDASSGPGSAAAADHVDDVGGEGQGSPQPPAAGSPSSVEEPSLKDLIVKLASQVKALPSQHRAVEGQEEEDVPADALRLRKIEKILSELTVKPEEEEANRALESGTLSAEPTEQERADHEGQTIETDVVSTPPSEDSPAAATEGPETAGEEPAEEFQETAGSGEIYGLILTVQNKVQGDYVARPEKLKSGDRWVVEYAMEEIEPGRARNLYKMVLNRRRKLLYLNKADEKRWHQMFHGKLPRYSLKGRRYRDREDRRQAAMPVHVYGRDTAYSWASVFEHSKDDGTRPYQAWQPQEPPKQEKQHSGKKSAWRKRKTQKGAKKTAKKRARRER